ncbi:hypothetical protein B0H17DRAFT_1162844 [Mycena rosella]|uniref:Uncharacterized protein n=1 Tax=Mycena rosella TaxID=1033263 RepID=A0AAD7CU32_MYCRO|nr:hypothetical protein B0H17DRAFT_1162844 [Mycena rosella]
MFLLDTLDNLPRLRISSSLMRVILWVLKEARCRETVPSFDHLRRVQKGIRAQCGISTIPCKSVQGNVFFMNDRTAIIAKDWANPTTRKMIHVYPEIPEDGIIREVWHAQKWRKNMDVDILSPMYDAGISHYYVNEVARLCDGNYVIPIRWVKFRGKVYADAFAVTVSMEAGHPDRMPNPKRAIAVGRPLYSLFVNYFAEDVSGNRTKSWNKHWNAYMTHANLPRQLLQQEFHIHFVSTSPNASSTICFSLYANAGPSDNPMQSEISAHIGGKGNCPCRKCQVGGTQQQKATNDEHILEELQKQVELGCSGTETGVKDMYTQFWIEQLISRFKEMKRDEPNCPVEEIRAELVQWSVENRDKIYGPFLTMKGFDPTKDTPIEILHTILLRIVKYIWHITHTPWSAEHKTTYTIRLQSTNTDGLSIHPIRSGYIMQYAGSLIGRQFKTLSQTNIFHVHGLVSDDEFQAWKASGELAALLWFPEIRNLADYRRDLKVAVANVLDIFATINPSKIVSKIKYHLLVHTDDDVVQFGPLVGLATELFESFNAVFRYCSILSNHLAPSRDIAIQLADQEGFKHGLTGGWWPSGSDDHWEHAGRGVRDFMVQHPILQKLVGWTEKKTVKQGDIRLIALKRGQKERDKCSLQSTNAVHAANYGLYTPASMWTKCVHVISESLEECFVASWVFSKSPVNLSSTISGRISDILTDSTEVFQIPSSRDEIYGMPVLVRRHSEAEFYIVPAENIKFKFNVQHDCRSAKFDAAGVRLRMQERVESDQTENYIPHKSVDHLVARIPIFTERRAKHDELAAQLRENCSTRKAAAAAKKQKCLEEDTNDDGDTEARPRKKKKSSAKRHAPKANPSRELMVANRGRRVITQTEKAKQQTLDWRARKTRG